jgi:hypothetical protein
MKNNNSMLLILAGTVTALAIIISGCSTEDPWSPNPESPLVLEMVSGPDADTVAYGSNISYSWTSRGGVPEVNYEYRVGSADWSTPSNITTVQLPNRTADGSFSVRATDDAGATLSISRQYYVGSAEGADTTPPTVWIDSSPAEGSYVATGSSITISWDGDDPGGAGDDLLFWWSFAGVDSDTSAARSVSFDDVMAADPAEFIVTAWDGSYHPVTWWRNDSSFTEPIADPDSIDYEMNTAEASVSFVIRDATILYVDDFLWYTGAGDVDLAKERDQKQFYRNALAGYAFAEWDVAEEGIPGAADLVPFNVIVWCADSDLGANDYTWNDSALAVDMDTYLTGGGKLLVTGPWTIGDMLDYDYEVQTGTFVYDWFAVDTIHQAIDTTWWWSDTPFDTLVAFPDSTVIDTSDLVSWDYWLHFTWAVAVENSLFDLPDSMKIDVAKNGDQDDYAIHTPFLRNDAASGVTTEQLFLWGLDVDGDQHPVAYNTPVGHVVSFSGVRQVAMLNFDTYAMPLPAITQTCQSILTKFGE